MICSSAKEIEIVHWYLGMRKCVGSRSLLNNEMVGKCISTILTEYSYLTVLYVFGYYVIRHHTLFYQVSAVISTNAARKFFLLCTDYITQNLRPIIKGI